MTNKYDIVIIGAGISGLSLAHYCASDGMSVLVVEKDTRTGGTLHSLRIEDTNGFWLELGAHTCYNSYRNLIGIIENCRISDRLLKREKVSFRMLIDGRIKSIPAQLNFPELIFSAPNFFTLKKEGQSIESYYSRIVGKKNYERVFTPAFNAVISQEAGAFPADMLFKKRERRKDIIKKFTFPGGLQTITDSITLNNNISVATGKEVSSIESSPDAFSVRTADGDIFEGARLALATQASVSVQLLQGVLPEVADKLRQINIAGVESVGVAVRKKAVSIPKVAGIFPRNDVFFSVVSRDIVPHDDYRGFTFHFRKGAMDNDARIKKICEVLQVKSGQIEYVATKNNSVPSLRVGHDKLIEEVDRLIAGEKIFLAGNYFGGVAIEDCVSRSLGEFKRLKTGI